MSYDPTIWKSGDVVTSAKLNKIEKGIEDAGSGGGGGALIAIKNLQDFTLNKTAGEIFDAFYAGQMVIDRYETIFDDEVTVSNNGLLICAEYEKGDGYYFYFYEEEIVIYSASSADDYPAIQHEG